ncbi:MAG: DUF547 domain-containing protein [Porticoccus sp.]|jgi:hypothetical protein|uniref:DUF547 domain-containing protein n=1 Tax=Porticoccus hydrocarbonoclasticus TaxID=1073414 RepID=UPI0009DEA33A|nr:DUF547 domain-containing protein [Porticoccus hydrocarbonoclasticus]MBG57274.1 DUF547 domain-containing protein [Porticoccus sp.]|tara:strand:- start:13601 stop:14422 length:822 start_codon:yes stop_codon:yes gene_type:complete
MMNLKYPLIIVLITGLFSASPAVTAESAQSRMFWAKSNESNRDTLNHRQWDELLRTHVVNTGQGVNRFRYGSVDKNEQKSLSDYIGYLAKIDPRDYSRDEQKAYWLNLYNALTVKLISENYPIKSIRDIGKKMDGHSLLNKPLIHVADNPISLNDIENRILRPIWKDHTIHFGLNCANMTCPGLLPQAFTGKNVTALLKQSGRDFINDQNGVTLKNGKLIAAGIFSQYRSDFAKDDKMMLKVFAHYADDRLALYLLGFQGKIDYFHDYSLNGL